MRALLKCRCKYVERRRNALVPIAVRDDFQAKRIAGTLGRMRIREALGNLAGCCLLRELRAPMIARACRPARRAPRRPSLTVERNESANI